MEVGAYLVAGPQAFELVEPGEGALDDPPGLAQAGSVGGALAGDLRRDAASAEESSVLVVVVTAVGEQPPHPVTRPTHQAADAGDRVQQGYELGDVVTVSAGQRYRKRCSVPVGDQVVLAAQAAAVDRRRSGVSPPLRARTCEASTAASSMSSRPALRSSARRILCRRGHTPASVQSRRRRQHVTPLQPIVSVGTSARSHPCAGRRRSRAEPHGHPPAAGPDSADAAAGEEGEAVRHVPTDQQAQDHPTPPELCRPPAQLPSP